MNERADHVFSGPQGQKSFAQEAEDLGVSVIAYSPLARGLVTGRYAESHAICCKIFLRMINRYRSRADFDQDDFRLILPRWSEENFPKNLEVVDKLNQIAQKYSATPSQVTLAWILAEHPTCQSSLKPTFLIHAFMSLIP